MTTDTLHRDDIHSMGTTSDLAPTAGRVAAWMLRAIAWYQRDRAGALSPCRFFPSCSEYAYEAIHQYGARRGGWLAARRLVRCRPFGPSGFDPVPERSVACCDHHKETTNV